MVVGLGCGVIVEERIRRSVEWGHIYPSAEIRLVIVCI